MNRSTSIMSRHRGDRVHEETPCAWTAPGWRAKKSLGYCSWDEFVRDWRALLTRHDYLLFRNVRTFTQRAIAYKFIGQLVELRLLSFQKCIITEDIAVCRRHKKIMDPSNVDYDRYIINCGGRTEFYRSTDCRVRTVRAPQRRIMIHRRDRPALSGPELVELIASN